MNRSLRWVLVLSLFALPLLPQRADAGAVADFAKDVVSHVNVPAVVGAALTGAAIGGAVGGPIGAIGGALVGAVAAGITTWHEPAPAAPAAPQTTTQTTTQSITFGGTLPPTRQTQTLTATVNPIATGSTAPGVPAPAFPTPTALPTTGPAGKVQRVIETNSGPSGTGGAAGTDATLKNQTDENARWDAPGGGNTDFFGMTGRKEEFVKGGAPGGKGLNIPGFYAGTACGSANTEDCGRHDKASTGFKAPDMSGFGNPGGGTGSRFGSGSASADMMMRPPPAREETFEGSEDDRFISQQVRAIPSSKGLGDVKSLRESTPLSVEEVERKATSLLSSAKEKLNSKDFEGALLELSEAIKLQPQNPTLYMYRSMANNLLGRYKEAESDARKAIELDPGNEQAWENLAWALLKQGKYQEALEAAKEVMKINPKNGMAYAISAFAKEKLGDKKGSLADIKKAASLDKRFKSFYQKAARGQPIYDPNAVSDLILTEEPAAPESGAGALVLLLLAACLLGGGGWYLKKKGLGSLFKRKPKGPTLQKFEGS